MAKKILSILCALAMMVTMVSVAAFSVSADEPTTGEIVFDADNFSFVKNSGTSIGYGVPASAAGEGLEKFAFIITKASATATSLDTYDIGDKFDISFQLVMYNSVNHTYTFSIGDLDIVLALSGTDPMSTITATYGDQTVIAADTVGNSIGRQVVSNVNKTNNTYISDGNTLDGNYLTGSNYSIILTNVTIGYDSGTLSVNLAKPGGAGKTMTGTISNADFTDSAFSIDFVQNASGYPMHAIHNFTGTYDLSGSDEPVVEDGEIIFDAENFNFPGTGNTFHGAIVNEDETDLEGGLEKYALTARSTSTSAASKNTYNIGDKFDISYSLMMADTNSHSWTLSVGKLAVVLALNSSGDRINASATYGGQTVIASTTLANSDAAMQVSSSNEYFTNALRDFKLLDTGYGSAPGGMFLSNVTISYDNGTLTLNVAQPSKAGATLTGTISNADFTDSGVSIVFSRTANKYPVHAFHNFTGTYTPYVAPEVDPLAPGKSLSINDSLALNFAYAEGALADYTDVEVNASIGERGETLTPVTKTIEGTTYDVYVVDFLTPDLFGTDVEFSITAKKGGEDVSYETTYSVKDYCVNMMNAAGSSDELKSLCASIVEYGEAARLWKVAEGISTTDTSITNGITDLVAGYNAMKPALWSADGKTNNYGLTGSEGPATWNSGNLNLADNIGINFTFTLPEGATMDDFNIVVDVVGSDIGMVGGDVESITDLGNNKYKAVARVFAYDMSKDVTAKIVVNDGSNTEASYVFTSGVQNYVLESIEAGNFTEGTAEYNCAVAFMTYGDAAAAYVG